MLIHFISECFVTLMRERRTCSTERTGLRGGAPITEENNRLAQKNKRRSRYHPSPLCITTIGDSLVSPRLPCHPERRAKDLLFRLPTTLALDSSSPSPQHNKKRMHLRGLKVPGQTRLLAPVGLVNLRAPLSVSRPTARLSLITSVRNSGRISPWASLPNSTGPTRTRISFSTK